MIDLSRRGFLKDAATIVTGAAVMLAAPAVVRANLIMPVRALSRKRWVITGYDQYGLLTQETIHDTLELPAHIKEWVIVQHWDGLQRTWGVRRVSDGLLRIERDSLPVIGPAPALDPVLHYASRLGSI